MFRILNYLKNIRSSLLYFALLTMTAVPAFAGPPMATDDSGTVDVGKVEIEFNGGYIYDKETAQGVATKNNAFDTEIKITTGLYKNLGVSLAIPYTFNQRIKEDNVLVSDNSGFGDMTLELKYAFLELAGINFAIKPAVIIPTGRYNVGFSEGKWQLGATLIASREFEDGKYSLHANVGYEYHDYRTPELRASDRSGFWSGSIAGEAEVTKGLFAVADFGVSTTADKTTNELTAYALTGLRYEVSDFLDVNAGVKFGLTKPEDDFTALYGVVLKF